MLRSDLQRVTILLHPGRGPRRLTMFLPLISSARNGKGSFAARLCRFSALIKAIDMCHSSLDLLGAKAGDSERKKNVIFLRRSGGVVTLRWSSKIAQKAFPGAGERADRLTGDGNGRSRLIGWWRGPAEVSGRPSANPGARRLTPARCRMSSNNHCSGSSILGKVWLQVARAGEP